jgi:hypothetical protein
MCLMPPLSPRQLNLAILAIRIHSRHPPHPLHILRLSRKKATLVSTSSPMKWSEQMVRVEWSEILVPDRINTGESGSDLAPLTVTPQ